MGRIGSSRAGILGILDTVAAPEDLAAVFELEGSTNDRISSELGILNTIPKNQWVLGQPMASVIMAAFCHPRPGGGRFNDSSRGAWYASFALRTGHREAVFHRSAELEEVGGWFDTFVQMVEYRADFAGGFHDLRDDRRFAKYLRPHTYAQSQKLARKLLERGATGIVYPSVRDPGGTCLASFRPRLVTNVRQNAFFEYRWKGARQPTIKRL